MMHLGNGDMENSDIFTTRYILTLTIGGPKKWHRFQLRKCNAI